jgi:hydrogenase/urease accessory protein HupE
MSPRARALAALGAWLWLALAPARSGAHPLDPALLELRESRDGQVAVLWRVPRSQPAATLLRPVLPGRCVERSAPSSGESNGPRLTSRWRVDCGAQGLVGERVGVDGLRERRTDALVRIALADGRLIQTVLRGDQSALTVPARVGRLDVTWDYLRLGFEHILAGLDHLLFVLGLVLLVRGRRRLLWTITAFTVGHSVTLSLAVLGIVRIPTAPVEALIAVTIFVVAVELTREPSVRAGWMRRAPWVMAFAFGLLHGLGFAGALAQVGLPANEIPLALFAFNVGIELGQLLFVGAVLAARATLVALPVPWPQGSARIPAYAIGSFAAFWVLDRVRGIFL